MKYILTLIFLVGRFSAKQKTYISSEPKFDFTKVIAHIPGYTNEEFMKGAEAAFPNNWKKTRS